MKTVVCHDINDKQTEVPVEKLRFRPSAYGVLIEDGKILLSKQRDGYDYPGGGVNIDETLEEAVEREFFEETGLKVRAKRAVLSTTSFFDPGTFEKYKGQYWNCPMIYLLVEKIGGTLTTEHFDENEKLYASLAEWIELEEIGKIKFVNSVDNKKILENALQLLNI